MDLSLQHKGPLSKSQQYILDQYISESNEPWCYHTQFSYHLSIRDLSLPLFFKAVKGVLDRHPVFRTVMVFEDGKAQQAINQTLSLQTHFSNIEDRDAEEQIKWLEAFLLDDRNHPFDVHDLNVPLCRTFVVKRGKESLQFILVFMHAIWDGWSLAVLLKEIFAYYHDLKKNPTLTLEEGRYEFNEFVSFEDRISRNGAAANFWRTHLERYEPYERVFCDTSTDYMLYKPAERLLPVKLSASLEQMQPKLKATIKAVYLAMFVRMIAEETKLSRATIAVVANGRSAELSNPVGTLGLLWNFAPLCAENVDDDIAHIRNVAHLLSETSAYASYPLSNILEDTGVSDMLYAGFNFINFEGANLLPSESDIEFLEVGGLDKFHFPLHLLVGKNPFNKNISLVLNYDTRFYSAAEIEEKLDVYVERLERLARLKN